MCNAFLSWASMADKPPPGSRYPAWDPMTPGKPWTSAMASLDDSTARQSRIAGDRLRYRDGHFRPSPTRRMAPLMEPDLGPSKGHGEFYQGEVFEPVVRAKAPKDSGCPWLWENAPAYPQKSSGQSHFSWPDHSGLARHTAALPGTQNPDVFQVVFGRKAGQMGADAVAVRPGTGEREMLDLGAQYRMKLLCASLVFEPASYGARLLPQITRRHPAAGRHDRYRSEQRLMASARMLLREHPSQLQAK